MCVCVCVCVCVRARVCVCAIVHPWGFAGLPYQWSYWLVAITSFGSFNILPDHRSDPNGIIPILSEEPEANVHQTHNSVQYIRMRKNCNCWSCKLKITNEKRRMSLHSQSRWDKGGTTDCSFFLSLLASTRRRIHARNEHCLRLQVRNFYIIVFSGKYKETYIYIYIYREREREREKERKRELLQFTIFINKQCSLAVIGHMEV